MIMKMRKCLWTTIIMICMVTVTYAQNAGDVFFERGIEAQKTLTSSSQKEAIELFEKAKIAYQSTENKAKCDQEISKCNKNIKSINQYKKAKENGDALYKLGEECFEEKKYSDALVNFTKAKEVYNSSKDKDKCEEKIRLCIDLFNSEPAKTNNSVETAEVTDSILIYENEEDITNNPQINFKNQRNQNTTLIIKASAEEWSYENNSEWLKVSKDDDSSSLILLIPDRNKGGIRTGIVTIVSGSASKQISITQQAAPFHGIDQAIEQGIEKISEKNSSKKK